MAGVMEASEDQPVHIKDIYVPLRLDKTNLEHIKSTEEVDSVKGQSIEEVLCTKQFIAISGAPGSGKSTLTKFLAAMLSQPENNHYTSVLGRRVVIPFILREFDFAKINSFDDLFSQWIVDINKRLGMKLTRDFFDFYISYGWAVVIFDGIDEISDEKNLALIDWINDWIDKNMSFSIAQYKINIIITGRPYGYLEKGKYDKFFEKLYIQPFNSNEIKEYADKWFSIRYRPDTVRIQQKVDDFIKAIKFYNLVGLKHRPIYLAMLAYVAETYGELPRTRTLAYSKIIDAYIHQLDLIKRLTSQKIWSYDDKIRFLEELAYKIHTKAEVELGNISDSQQMHIQISRETLKTYFKDIIKEERFGTIKDNEVDELVRYFLARTGLIVEPKEGYIQFSHLTFQEYLVAARIYRKKDPFDLIGDLTKEIFDKLDKTGWYEIALLYFGIDSIRAGQHQSKILQRVIQKNNNAHHKFIIDLIANTEHKLSVEEEQKWLKTLIYLWLLNDSADTTLFKYMQKSIQKLTEVHEDVEKYIATYTDNILGDISLYDSSIILLNREQEPDNKIDILKNIFLVGIYWDTYRKSYFSKERIDKLQKIIKENKNNNHQSNTQLAVILDKYLDFHNKEDAILLSNVIFQLITLNEYHVLFGNSLYYVFYYNNEKIHNMFMELFIMSHMGLLFTLKEINSGIDKFDTFRKEFLAINRARDLARDLARYLARDLDRYLDRDLDRDLDRYLAQYLDRYLAQYLDRYLDRDLDRYLDQYLAQYLDRDLDRDLARYLDQYLDRYLDRDLDRRVLRVIIGMIFIYYYKISEKIYKSKNIRIQVSKKNFFDTYASIKTDDNAITYFKERCGDIVAEREQEIIEWLNSSYSPRKIMELTSKYIGDEEFDAEVAIKDFHEFVKASIEKLEKK